MHSAAPHLEHEEKALLGHAIAYDRKQPEFFDGASEALFFTSGHRVIYRAMQRLHDRGQAVDIASIVTELMASKEIEAANGAGYISGLVEGVMKSFDVAQHIATLREIAARRRLIENLESAIDGLYGGDSTQEVCARVERDIATVESGAGDVEVFAIKDFLVEELDAIATEHKSDRRMMGVPTGISDLDAIMGGWRDSEYSLIGAWPSRGKTSMLLQSAHTAASNGFPALILSLEMRKGELLRRLIAYEAKLRPRKLRNPREMNITEYQQAVNAGEKLATLPLYVCDQDSLDPAQITATAKLWIKKAGVRIVFVDFVQIIRERGRDAREVVNKISAGLRSLAKNAAVPVVAASQLARASGRNTNERPNLFHLKESGNLEQDAHNVLLLYRPVDERGDFTGDDEVLIAKQRHGIIGPVPVFYNGNTLMFESRQQAST